MAGTYSLPGGILSQHRTSIHLLGADGYLNQGGTFRDRFDIQHNGRNHEIRHDFLRRENNDCLYIFMKDYLWHYYRFDIQENYENSGPILWGKNMAYEWMFIPIINPFIYFLRCSLVKWDHKSYFIINSILFAAVHQLVLGAGFEMLNLVSTRSECSYVAG